MSQLPGRIPFNPFAAQGPNTFGNRMTNPFALAMLRGGAAVTAANQRGGSLANVLAQGLSAAGEGAYQGQMLQYSREEREDEKKRQAEAAKRQARLLELKEEANKRAQDKLSWQMEGGGNADLAKWEQERKDLTAAGWTDQEIAMLSANRARFQPVTGDFGKAVFDRQANTYLSPEEAATAALTDAPQPGAPAQVISGQPSSIESQPLPPAPDYSEATGGSGFFKQGLNTITDMFGAGSAYPEAEKAAQDLKQLQGRTELFLTASVPGRESNQVRQRLREDFSITPGSLFTGDARALVKFKNTKDFIDGEIGRLRGVLANPEGYKPQQIAAARENIGQLQSLADEYQLIVDNFDRKGQAAPQYDMNSGATYESIPSGSTFVAPDGTIRRKP